MQVFGYYASGSETEATLRDNRAVFSRYRLMPRMMVDVSNMDTTCTLLGTRHNAMTCMTCLPFPIYPASRDICRPVFLETEQSCLSGKVLCDCFSKAQGSALLSSGKHLCYSTLRSDYVSAGRQMAYPVLIAPMAMQCMAHPDGELAVSRAAAAEGISMVRPTFCCGALNTAGFCNMRMPPIALLGCISA